MHKAIELHRRTVKSGWGRRVAALMLGGTVALAASGPAPAEAATLNFDDISGCLETFASVGASNYGGLDWSASWGVECDANYQGDWLNEYGAPSPANAAYNAFGEFGVFIDAPGGATFDFLGGQVASWTLDDELSDEFTGFGSTNLAIVGYRNGILQGELYHLFSSVGYAPLDMTSVIGTLNGLDQLYFYSFPDAQRSWLLDNFEYELHPVPEPGSLLLFGTGLAVLSTRLRKRTPERRE